MLGIAGLYVHGMQAGRTAMFSHHAVTLAGDVADRIRANPRAGAAYAGPGANNNCVGAGIDCDEQQMAAHDIFTWEQQAQDFLPNGTVTVQFDGASLPPEYTITVGWSEPGENPTYVLTIPVLGI
jgi:type IV pilus assembly protein PilV